MKSSLRKSAQETIDSLRDERSSWWSHWLELSEYILPRRYRWLVTANARNRGSQINNKIIDSTGTIASRVLASGMMAGVTSPTRPWFRLKVEGVPDVGPGAIWLSECERRMRVVFQKSNFYTSMAVMYHDLAVFGSSLNIIYEDFDDVIRCYNPCLGEFFFATDSTGRVCKVGREFTQTIYQLVTEFGEENVPKTIRDQWVRGGAGLNREIVVYHLIEPNLPGDGALPKQFKFRELYWCLEAPSGEVLRSKGYFEWPCLNPRWDLAANDAYGRSPAMDCLGDIKQLQQETKRKAQAIDKMVNPPMVADIQLKNQPASLLPGGVTYVSMANNNAGFKPVYQVQPPLMELKEDILQVQGRIKDVFYNDLFKMISDLQTVRTATEIDARREEKLVMLGPVLERFENEALNPAIERTFAIMKRLQLLPPPPPDIAGKAIQIQYSSMLAEAQQAIATSGIERGLSLAGNLAGVDPGIMDVYDLDETIREYNALLATPPKILREQKAVDAIRAQRAKAQQAAQAAQATPGLAQAAGNLSKVRLGNGQSALDAVMGNSNNGGG